jgi:hypothetical protein
VRRKYSIASRVGSSNSQPSFPFDGVNDSGARGPMNASISPASSIPLNVAVGPMSSMTTPGGGVIASFSRRPGSSSPPRTHRMSEGLTP